MPSKVAFNKFVDKGSPCFTPFKIGNMDPSSIQLYIRFSFLMRFDNILIDDFSMHSLILNRFKHVFLVYCDKYFTNVDKHQITYFEFIFLWFFCYLPQRMYMIHGKVSILNPACSSVWFSSSYLYTHFILFS